MLPPQIMHPAVVPFDPPATDLENPRNNIILLGRLFAGRQSKGHHIAIKLFKKLRCVSTAATPSRRAACLLDDRVKDTTLPPSC